MIPERGAQDLHSFGFEPHECRGCILQFLRGIAVFDEVDGLAPEFGILGDPLEDIGWIEGLSVHLVGGDVVGDKGVDHVARILLLRVAVEWHRGPQQGVS